MTATDPDSNQHVNLPLELRAALDLIVRETCRPSGEIEAELIGSPLLVAELSKYARITPSTEVLIMLLATPQQTAASAGSSANEIWTLTEGSLGRLLGPLRSPSAARIFVKHMPDRHWDNHGFRRQTSIAVQGAGSIAWAIAERILRRMGRPDLADRCRIGMLRTLVAARPLNFGTVQIRHFTRSSDG